MTVDTTWNSDSSWYDGNGLLQSRQSRDCKISFTPQGEGTARIFIAISIDSGKTWAPSPDPLRVLNNALSSTFPTGRKATVTARVFGGDRPGTAFKITARQAAPVIAGNPKTMVLSGTTPGANVEVVLNARLVDTSGSDGFCTAAKVYWDALGDGTINDSTTGVNAFSWTWNTQVPAGMAGQSRSVIVRAIDKNNLRSAPETLKVQFGLPQKVLFKEGFETDLSAFRRLKFNPMDPMAYGFLTISTLAAHSGSKSVTTDSNFSGLLYMADTLIFSGIIGIEFYMKATALGQTNFNAVMAKNGGSADAMMCWAGFGFDMTDSIRALLYDNPNQPTSRTHGKIEINRWYKFNVEFDWNTNLATYFIDGQPVDTMAANISDLDEIVVWRDKIGAQGPKGYFLDDLLFYIRKD